MDDTGHGSVPRAQRLLRSLGSVTLSLRRSDSLDEVFRILAGARSAFSRVIRFLEEFRLTLVELPNGAPRDAR